METVPILFVFHTIRTQLRQIFQPDVLCKVCDVAPVSSSIMMISAKMTCSSGWSIEYAGVLTAACQYSGLAIREYLCIDENAEHSTLWTVLNRTTCTMVD